MPGWKAGEEGVRVAREPPRERAVTPAFERMQEPQGDDLAGPEVSLGMLRNRAQLLIYLIEQGDDKIDGGHTALLAWEGCHRDQRGGVV